MMAQGNDIRILLRPTSHSPMSKANSGIQSGRAGSAHGMQDTYPVRNDLDGVPVTEALARKYQVSQLQAAVNHGHFSHYRTSSTANGVCYMGDDSSSMNSMNQALANTSRGQPRNTYSMERFLRQTSRVQGYPPRPPEIPPETFPRTIPYFRDPGRNQATENLLFGMGAWSHS